MVGAEHDGVGDDHEEEEVIKLRFRGYGFAGLVQPRAELMAAQGPRTAELHFTLFFLGVVGLRGDDGGRAGERGAGRVGGQVRSPLAFRVPFVLAGVDDGFVGVVDNGQQL